MLAGEAREGTDRNVRINLLDYNFIYIRFLLGKNSFALSLSLWCIYVEL